MWPRELCCVAQGCSRVGVADADDAGHHSAAVSALLPKAGIPLPTLMFAVLSVAGTCTKSWALLPTALEACSASRAFRQFCLVTVVCAWPDSSVLCSYVIGSLLTGRFVVRHPDPRRPLAWAVLLYAAANALVLLAPSTTLLTALFAAICALLIFLNVVACTQLEHFARAMQSAAGGDQAASERTMALTCLFWQAGFAIGSALGSLPETLSQQRLSMLGSAALNLAFLPLWPGCYFQAGSQESGRPVPGQCFEFQRRPLVVHDDAVVFDVASPSLRAERRSSLPADRVSLLSPIDLSRTVSGDASS